MEIRRRARALVEQGVDKARRLSNALVDERDQSSPQRGDSARTPNHVGVAIDKSYVAGARISIAGHVRNASTYIVI